MIRIAFVLLTACAAGLVPVPTAHAQATGGPEPVASLSLQAGGWRVDAGTWMLFRMGGC